MGAMVEHPPESLGDGWMEDLFHLNPENEDDAPADSLDAFLSQSPEIGIQLISHGN